jgi:hypothetical protein
MPVQIQTRNGTAAQWTSANPTLAAGEVGIETDTRKQKFGDGTTAWNSLAYAGSSGTVTSVGQTFTGGIVSVAGSPVISSGTLALTVAGTSGGVPYFSSGTTWASSAALASNSLVVGGGAGAAPSTVTTGTGVVTALGVNTGSAGAFVVNGGALGTPSGGTLTNATGLPISTGVSGLGTNVATFLATPSSANLAAAVTDETGTGLVVFNNTPELTNPTVTNYTETNFTATVTSNAITLSLTNGTFQTITTMVGANAITLPAPATGKSLTVLVVYASTPTSLTFTSPSGTLKYPGGTTPTATLTNTKVDIYAFISDGTNWYGVQSGANF